MEAPGNAAMREMARTLQEHRSLATPEDLARALREDLEDEGCPMDSRVLDRIQRIAEEVHRPPTLRPETLLKGRVRDPRLVSVLTAVAALLAWCATSALGAVVEYYVQKPLDQPAGPASEPLTASVQVLPEQDGSLPYRVVVGNRSTAPLQGLEVVAVASGRSDSRRVPSLDAGAHATVEGSVPNLPEGPLELVTYVLGPGVHFKSDPLALRGPARRPPGVPGGRPEPVTCQRIECAPEVDLLLEDLATLDPSDPRYATDLSLLRAFARSGNPRAGDALARLSKEGSVQ